MLIERLRRRNDPSTRLAHRNKDRSILGHIEGDLVIGANNSQVATLVDRKSRPELCYLIADALSWLPEQVDATERYCEAAAEGYRDESAPDWDFGSSACVDAIAALVMVARGEYHHARRALTPLLGMVADARLFSIRQSVARVDAALRASSMPHSGTVELRNRLLRQSVEKGAG